MKGYFSSSSIDFNRCNSCKIIHEIIYEYTHIFIYNMRSKTDNAIIENDNRIIKCKYIYQNKTLQLIGDCIFSSTEIELSTFSVTYSLARKQFTFVQIISTCRGSQSTLTLLNLVSIPIFISCQYVL